MRGRIEKALARDAELEAAGIRVQVAQDKVTLEGRVHSLYEKRAAERAAWAAPGVRAVEDPDAPENWPRVWFIWRGNALMASSKGHEYFLKHYLGTHHNSIAEEIAGDSVQEVVWHKEAPQ